MCLRNRFAVGIRATFYRIETVGATLSVADTRADTTAGRRNGATPGDGALWIITAPNRPLGRFAQLWHDSIKS